MEHMRRARGQIFVLLCALVAAGIAIYLTSVHYQLAPLACSESGFVNCARVLDSMYAVVPGTAVPISIPGLAWALVMAALVIIELRRPSQHPPYQANRLLLAQFAWSLIGMLAVLYLVYVEIVLLHNLCAWCTAMHVLIFLIFLVTLARLLPSQPEVSTSESSEQASAEVGPISDRR